jgi:hypothetical protein
MRESHTPDESRSAPNIDITDIEPIDLINLDLEEYGWRFIRPIGREYLDRDDLHVEVYNRGDEVLEIAWVGNQDVINPKLRLRSPLDINDTRWPVSTPEDVARALDEDRRLAQPLPAIYDTSPRRDTPTELYVYRTEIAQEIAEFLSEQPVPATEFGVEDTGRPRTLDLDPNLPPWEMDHDGVVFDGPPQPQPQALEPGDPDWPPWLSTEPLWDSPSLEESFASDAMAVDRSGDSGREVPASQRFAAMDPEQLEAARGLLRDYPGDAPVPWDEVGRRGLTLDDVSLVYAAEVGDLPDVATTDPWRAPPAAPWQPATATLDTEHDDPGHDLERVAGVADVAAEPGGETSVERLGPDRDGIGEAEGPAIRTALDRLVGGDEPRSPRRGYTIGDLAAAVDNPDPWAWGDPAASARHARIGPEPDGPPWDVNDERVSGGGEPGPRVMRVILPDGRTAYMDAPAPAGPEEPVSRDAMAVDRDNEPPSSQRFAAMDPEQVEAARGLLRDYPDAVPFDEVTRRGLDLDDVSLVYLADTGDLPDSTTTDPWRPPPATPWQPATTAPDTEHDDAHHDLERVAGVVPERGRATTPEQLGPGTDGTGEAPDDTTTRTALNRLVDGEITDEDLARIGITPEQYARLIDTDADSGRAASASDEASAGEGSSLDNDGDEPDFDFWRDVIGDDIVVGGVVYSADVYTPDGEGGVRRLTDSELDTRPVSSEYQAADQLDRLQERLADVRETLRASARERAPTGEASPPRAPGRQVDPGIGDGSDLSYGYPADADPADPLYQQSEIGPGPDIDI